jgi:hypothetical protein
VVNSRQRSQEEERAACAGMDDRKCVISRINGVGEEEVVVVVLLVVSSAFVVCASGGGGGGGGWLEFAFVSFVSLARGGGWRQGTTSAKDSSSRGRRRRQPVPLPPPLAACGGRWMMSSMKPESEAVDISTAMCASGWAWSRRLEACVGQRGQSRMRTVPSC